MSDQDAGLGEKAGTVNVKISIEWRRRVCILTLLNRSERLQTFI